MATPGRNHAAALVTSAPFGILIVTPEGRLRSVNPAGAELLGLSPEALLAASAVDLLALGDVAADSLPTTTFRRIVRNDNAAIWLRLDVHALGGDGEANQGDLAVFLSDVTALHAHQRQAEATASGLDLVASRAPLPLCLTNEAGRLLFWNDACAQLFGLSAAVVVGRPLAEATGLNPSETDGLLRSALDGQPAPSLLMVPEGASAAPITVEVTAAPLRERVMAFPGARP